MRLRTGLAGAAGALFVLLAAAVTAPGTVQAQDDLNSFRVASAAAVDPVSWTPCSGSGCNHTQSSLPSGVSARSPEVRALARALNYDPQAFLAFVRDNVEVNFTFGSQKGALGALIDLEGNPADQALLMYELLREAGEVGGANVTNVRIAYGRLTLNAQQFYDWAGIDRAAAACRFLASGGIPVRVNGSTNCDGLSNNPGSVNQVVVGHFWARATVGGVATVFDPSAKRHENFAGESVMTLAGLTPGAALTTALSGSQTGTSGGAGFTSHLNNRGANSLSAFLDGRAEQLYGALDASTGPTIRYDRPLEEVIGGRRIAAVFGESFTDMGTRAQVSNWTAIPDALRSRVTLSVDMCNQLQPPPNCVENVLERSFFSDEIYGRTVDLRTSSFNPTYSPPPQVLPWCEAPPHSTQWFNYTLALSIDGQAVPGGVFTDRCSPFQRDVQPDLVIAVDEAYPASGGTYMDRTVRYRIDLVTRAVLVLGRGSSGGGAARRLADILGVEPYAPASIDYSGCDPLDETCLQHRLHMTSSSENLRNRLAPAYLEQLGRMAELQAAVGSSRVQHHHTLGVVFGNTTVTGDFYQYHPPGYPPIGAATMQIGSESLLMTISTGMSVTRLDGDAGRRRAVAASIAAAAATLEGSVAEQLLDSVDPQSTASKFDYANDGPRDANDDRLEQNNAAAYNPSQWGGRRRFFTARAAGSYNPLPIQGGSNSYQVQQFQSFRAAGYDIVVPDGDSLGPGPYCGPYESWMMGAFTCLPNEYRGHAFMAAREQGATLDFAHMVLNQGFAVKGAGAAADPLALQAMRVPTQADILAEQDQLNWPFTPDLGTGTFAYAVPGISTGHGSFPYALDWTWNFSSGALG